MKTISEMTPCELAQLIHQQRILIRNLGKLMRVSDRQDVHRASGQAICEKCGLELYEHPLIPEASAVMGCNGELYHL